tara:strand:- start:64 stop:483 length:420 start_codon:yes stop_codon:yes gene_type:complete
LSDLKNDDVKDKPKRRGRPPKSEMVNRKRGTVGTRGRPKGDAAIINEYKTRMLTSPKSARVLESIFDAALNDDHKNQAAAWKLVIDRVLPASYFEKDTAGGSKGGINISITGVGGETTVISESSNEEQAEDGEFIDIQS